MRLPAAFVCVEFPVVLLVVLGKSFGALPVLEEVVLELGGTVTVPPLGCDSVVAPLTVLGTALTFVGLVVVSLPWKRVGAVVRT